MQYCPSCGHEVSQEGGFCPNCGASLSPYQQAQTEYEAPRGQPEYTPPPVYPVSVPEKSAGIALILGLVLGIFGIWGIGQIYVGKIGKGIILLVVGILIMPLLFALVIFGTIITFGFSWILIPLLGIIGFILWLWQAFDAYMLANRYNAEARRTGMPPW